MLYLPSLLGVKPSEDYPVLKRLARFGAADQVCVPGLAGKSPSKSDLKTTGLPSTPLRNFACDVTLTLVEAVCPGSLSLGRDLSYCCAQSTGAGARPRVLC